MSRKLISSAVLIGSVLAAGVAYGGLSIHYGHHGHGHYGHYYGYGYRYGHHYSYRPYGYYGYPHGSYYYPRYDANASIQRNADYAPADTRQAVARDDTTGWKLLAEGKWSEASSVFSNQAQSHPNYGVAKAGYAIAVAMNGDLERGVWAMRRAFRVDPKSLHYVNIDAKLEAVLGDLGTRYRNHGSDAVFMQAAFAYLRQDYATARVEIDRALSAGDRQISTRNLNTLLAESAQPVADSKKPDSNNYQ